MTITLYRGDFEKIEKFEIVQTSKYCAVGQGIYLTNNKDVANSYRVKGSEHNAEDKHIWMGKANDRNHAYSLAFNRYVAIQLGMGSFDYIGGKKGELILKNSDKYIDQYKIDIADGLVKANYVNQYLKELVVTYDRPVTHGHLSAFNFQPSEFNTSMFMVDGVIRDEFFWELIWDNNIDFGELGDGEANKSNFIKYNTSPFGRRATFNNRPGTMRGGAGLRMGSANKIWKKIANLLEPYGYKGFEYTGGSRTSSCVKHRAFVVWDENWINEHRIY